MPALVEVLQTLITLQQAELDDISMFSQTLSLSHDLLRQYQGKDLMQQLAVIKLFVQTVSWTQAPQDS